MVKETKNKTNEKITKGEIVLQSIVITILIGLLAFMGYIIAQLIIMNRVIDTTTKFQEFVHIDSDDLNLLLRITAGEEGLGYDMFGNNHLRGLLTDSAKPIFILFYSSLEADFDTPNGFSSLESSLHGLPTGNEGRGYIILFNLRTNFHVFDDVIIPVFENFGITKPTFSQLSVPHLLRLRLTQVTLNSRFDFFRNTSSLPNRISDILHNQAV